jgi:hypothetical protein
MHSEAHRATLARGVGKYVLAVAVGAIAEVKTEVLSRTGRYRKIEENLLAQERVMGDGERRQRSIVCFNPKEAERQAQHRAEVIETLQEELTSPSATSTLSTGSALATPSADGIPTARKGDDGEGKGGWKKRRPTLSRGLDRASGFGPTRKGADFPRVSPTEKPSHDIIAGDVIEPTPWSNIHGTRVEANGRRLQGRLCWGEPRLEQGEEPSKAPAPLPVRQTQGKPAGDPRE